MNDTSDFPNFSIRYTKAARAIRRTLPPDARNILDEIEDVLSDVPDGNPMRTTKLPVDEEIYIYRHPSPHLEITFKVNREAKVLDFLHLVAPVMETTKPLFISYSHKDQKWMIELKKWLRPLEQRDLIKIWDDRDIQPGDDWRNEIENALKEAKAAVLLISQDFLNSEFITSNELPVLLNSAKDKGVKIFWIAVRDSTVDDTDISMFQAVHKEPPLSHLEPEEQEKHFLQIYKKIKEVVE